MPAWWNGRHNGLKIRRPLNGHAGSSPAAGTTKILTKSIIFLMLSLTMITRPGGQNHVLHSVYFLFFMGNSGEFYEWTRKWE